VLDKGLLVDASAHHRAELLRELSRVSLDFSSASIFEKRKIRQRHFPPVP